MALIETRGSGPLGRRAVDREGRKLGKIDRVYGDPPSWAAVKARPFGKSHMVPLREARTEGDDIRLAATKPQVKHAPGAPPGAALASEVEARLRDLYSQTAAPPRGAGKQARPAARRRTMAVPRSRGAVSGILLLLLGIWGAFSPLVGPYFGYAFGQDDAWNPSTDMLWLSFLPAAAVVIGALILMTSTNRASGGIGAWLALAGGLWLVVGPASSILWDGGGPDAPIGRPLGDEGLRVTELLWSFYGLGALITAVAAFALGRLATVSIRDMRAADERN